MRLFALAVLTVAWAGAPERGRSEVRLENEHVLVQENLYEPGEASPMHSHSWPRVVYVLDGGELEMEDQDGGTSRITLDPGMTVWRPAGTHVVRNVGRTAVRVLETEIKNARE